MKLQSHPRVSQVWVHTWVVIFVMIRTVPECLLSTEFSPRTGYHREQSLFRRFLLDNTHGAALLAKLRKMRRLLLIPP